MAMSGCNAKAAAAEAAVATILRSSAADSEYKMAAVANVRGCKC